MYISFIHPFYLTFLFVIPILIFFHFFGIKNIHGKSLKFANFEAIARIRGIDLYSKNISLLILNIIFIILIVLAFSGTSLNTALSASSFSFVIAIDSSESMMATDLQPNRISVAKETALTFIDSLPADSPLAIISFSGVSHLEQELTSNKLDLKTSIQDIQISNVAGTDILEAVSNSVSLLRGEKRKAILLLSDGQINTGSMDDVINLAKSENIIVHTFGIGTVAGGETTYGLSKLDEEGLKGLAYNTGGEYFNIQNQQDLELSFDKIIAVTERMGKIDLTFYLFVSILVLFILKEFLLSINKIIW
jgi:Ca-activated chloride channel homolog